MALSASPGFEILERSIFGLTSACGLLALALRFPPLK
jgi:hypothetical protein